MTSQLVSLAFDADDPRRLARFWAAALRWETTADGVGLVPTDGTRFDVRFLPAPGPKTNKNRVHLDLTTTSLDDQRASVESLIGAGARHVDIGQRPDEPHVVLADPEGNEFCVIEPGNGFLAGTGRLGAITCDGSPRAGRFWSEALGWPLVWDQDEETAIRAPDGNGPFVTWGPPVPPPTVANRLHLHLAPSAHHPELDRLVSLGASHVETTGDRAILSDPDGNEFSLLTG